MSVHDSPTFVEMATRALRTALDQDLAFVNLEKPFASLQLVIGSDGIPPGAIDLSSIPDDLKGRLKGRVPYVKLV